MAKISIAITGIGVVCSLGQSGRAIAQKLIRGSSGVSKWSFQSGAPDLVAARVRRRLKTITSDRWPISRSTALALEATRAVLPYNGTPLPPEAGLGLIHATAYGNLQSLLNYQSDLRRFGLRRASPMQFPNTILHAAASFLSIGVGATAFNLTLCNENLSGVDALETASHFLELGAADRVLVVTSEDVSAELIPLLESYDELDGKVPDPFGEKRSGYVPGEAAVAMLLERTEQAKKKKKQIYAVLCGSSGVSHDSDTPHSCERTIRMTLKDAELSTEDVGCIFASANGSRSDGEEANAIASVFGNQVPVTALAAALGECGASTPLLSIVAAIHCAHDGYHPPTLGRSKYDNKLAPINLLRHKLKLSNPIFLVNAFNKTAKCSQIWRLCSWKQLA